MTLTHDFHLDFQSPASYGYDLLICKSSRSTVSRFRRQNGNKRADRRTEVIALPLILMRSVTSCTTIGLEDYYETIYNNYRQPSSHGDCFVRSHCSSLSLWAYSVGRARITRELPYYCRRARVSCCRVRPKYRPQFTFVDLHRPRQPLDCPSTTVNVNWASVARPLSHSASLSALTELSALTCHHE